MVAEPVKRVPDAVVMGQATEQLRLGSIRCGGSRRGASRQSKGGRELVPQRAGHQKCNG